VEEAGLANRVVGEIAKDLVGGSFRTVKGGRRGVSFALIGDVKEDEPFLKRAVVVLGVFDLVWVGEELVEVVDAFSEVVEEEAFAVVGLLK
jgi:hypothetical protein